MRRTSRRATRCCSLYRLPKSSQTARTIDSCQAHTVRDLPHLYFGWFLVLFVVKVRDQQRFKVETLHQAFSTMFSMEKVIGTAEFLQGVFLYIKQNERILVLRLTNRLQDAVFSAIIKFASIWPVQCFLNRVSKFDGSIFD
jgi:hypothetical protein